MTTQELNIKVRLQDLISPTDQQLSNKQQRWLDQCQGCFEYLEDICSWGHKIGVHIPIALYEPICDFYYRHQAELN